MHSLSLTWIQLYFVVALCGFFVALALTYLLIRIAPQRGWVSVPRKDRWSVRVVAHFGGLPVILAYSTVSLLFFRNRQSWIILLLTWGMALLGLMDDFLGLRPSAKLATQIGLALLAVVSGIVHPLTGHIWLNVLFTVFWIVGITNAINLLDNIDGLAAGIAVIACAQVIFLAGPESPISGLALCMLAACAGFLVFNFNPAKIFMGDVGALSIGFFLACASVRSAEHLSSLTSVLFVPCLVLFIPIFDTFLVSFTRRLNGRRIFLGARDHTSHRLVMLGLNERQAVWLLYGIALTGGIMAFLWKSSWGNLGAGLVALFLIGSALFWVYLAKLELPSTWLSPECDDIVRVPRLVQRVIFKSSIVLLDAAVIVVAIYLAYVIKFENLDRTTLGRFLFAAALSLGIKLPLLTVFGVYEQHWDIKSRREIYPVLNAVFLGACLLTAISVSLPSSKAIESSVILFDAIGTASLLVLCRYSARIFDDLLGTPRLINYAVKRIVHWAGIRPSEEPQGNGYEAAPDPSEVGVETREKESRPN